MGIFFKWQETLDLNVLVCGNNIPNDYKQILNNKDNTHILNNMDYSESLDIINIFIVHYIKIKDENNHKIVEFIEYFYKKKNIILYFSKENDESKEDLNLIKDFSDKNSKYHPFFIFCTGKDKNYYTDYLKKLKNYFDPRNIYCVNYNNFNKEYRNIIIGRGYYFYEKGNLNSSGNNIAINLCVLGRPGCGKSTFINTLFDEKVAPEGTLENITSQFRGYQYTIKIGDPDEYGSINIYDSPGFTLDGEKIKIVEDFIDSKFKYFKENHDYIHAFLYFFVENAERTLEDSELDIIEFIHKKQKDYNENSIVLFIINKCEENKENDPNSFKQKLFITLKNKFGEHSEYSKLENIIELNLKTKDGRKAFGLNKVFETLYNFFLPHKVAILQEQNESNEEILNSQKSLISNSMFFKYIKNENDLFERFQNSIDGLINIFSEITGVYGAKSDIKSIKNARKEMLNDIKAKFNSDINTLDSSKLDQREIYDGWFKHIPILGDWLDKKHLYEHSPEITKEMGEKFKRMHQEKMKKTSEITFLKNCIKYYNNSIELLKILSQKNTFEIKERSYIYESENVFIIEFETPFLNPQIACHQVLIIGENYFFKIEITNIDKKEEKFEPITLLKSIKEMQLAELKRKEVKKIKDEALKKCKVKVYYSLLDDSHNIIID